MALLNKSLLDSLLSPTMARRLAFCIVLVAHGLSMAADQPDAIAEALSGSRAKADAIVIAQYYREDGTPGYDEALAYIAGRARAAGLKNLHVEQFDSDNRARYLGLRTRFGWNPKSAQLWLAAPQKQKLADFREDGTALATWSTAADVTAEIVDIGPGTRTIDYTNNVRGKLVLTSSPPSLVQHEAVAVQGAAGIVSDWSPPSRSSRFPDQVQWLDTANNSEEVKAFAFVISPRAGAQLRALMRKHRVTLRAKVNATLESGKLSTLTGVIPGTDKAAGEVAFIAHVCHFRFSANDDASGAGLLLELARTINSLIAAHKVQPPRRTIRFFWVNENYGTVAYLNAHPELPSRLRAVIDLDMVGEDLEKCGAIFRVISTPESRPSYLPDLLQVETQRVASLPSGQNGFRYEFNEYIGGSDHVWFNDAGTGVPAVLLEHWPDNFYHSSQDTPDKIDAHELHRVGIIAARSAMNIATADQEGAIALAQLTARSADERLSADLASAIDALHNASQAQQIAISARLRWDVERETLAIASAASLTEHPQPVKDIARRFHADATERIGATIRSIDFTQPNSRSLTVVYQRNGRYLSALWKTCIDELQLSVKDQHDIDRLRQSLPYGDASIAEILNLIDGRRTVGEVLTIASVERQDDWLWNDYYGIGKMQRPTPFQPVAIDYDAALNFFAIAEKAGLIRPAPAEKVADKTTSELP